MCYNTIMGHIDFKTLINEVHIKGTVKVELSLALAKRLRQRFYRWRRQQRVRGFLDADSVEANIDADGVVFTRVSTEIEDAVKGALIDA